MNSQELSQEAALSYSELCTYLQRKYGIPENSYFCTPECKSKRKKNSRGCDGLECHHIREDLVAQLSNPEVARNCPWEWQEKENLVYCNLLEHLLLHIKIAVFRQKRKLASPDDVSSFFSTQGVFFICQSINDCYLNKNNLSSRAKANYQQIENNYEDYLTLLNATLTYLIKQFPKGTDKHDILLKTGSTVVIDNTAATIIGLTKNRDHARLRFPDGSEKVFLSYSLPGITYYDHLIDIKRYMCRNWNSEVYLSLYSDLSRQQSASVETLADALTVDFLGYGFPQFADHYLDRNEYGSENIDMYLI